MEKQEGIANVLADKALLDVLASDSDNEFSKTAFQTVLDVLDKVSLPSSLDHGILQKIYDRLRSWSSFADVSSVFPLLARVYDNLIHRNLGQPNNLNSVCELLFLIEDMADHRECKKLAGEHFLQRLLALAGTKLTGIKLQRTAVETLSSIISMCPPNQKLLYEELHAEWLNFIRKVLPLCGDFFVQASIVEILYRLSKRNPGLLDCLEDKTLREKMASFHQKKKPNLLIETRSFLDDMNNSLGKSRSVYSFLAEDIILDSQGTPLNDERWVHFGMDHLSCYAALDANSEKDLGNVSKGVSLLDVFYDRICDVQVCSNHSVEFAFRDTPSLAQNSWIRLKTFKLKVVLKTEELEILMDSVLTRIKYYQIELQKGGSRAVDSDNTSTTPSFSEKMERSFRKASVGFAIPLPRKLKLPSLPRNCIEQVNVNSKLSGKLMIHPKEAQTQSVATCKYGGSDKEVVDPNSAEVSTQVFQVANSKETNNCISACQPEEYREAGPKQDMFSCPQSINNRKVLPPFSHLEEDINLGATKISGMTSLQTKKEAVSICDTDASLNTLNLGHKGDAPNRPRRKNSAKENWSNEAEPRLELEAVNKGAIKINGRTNMQSKKDAVSSCDTNACLNNLNLGHKGDAPNRPKRKTGFDSGKENWDNETEPTSELKFVDKGTKKLSGRTSLQSKKDAVSGSHKNAHINTINVGHNGDTPNRPKNKTCFDSPMKNCDNQAEPRSELEFIGKASGQDIVGTDENAIQRTSVSKGGKPATNNALAPKDVKSADIIHATHLQERILNILNSANLAESGADETRTQKNSTSDPIETDSEQNRSAAKKIRTKVIPRSTLRQKPQDHCKGQDLRATFRIKRRSRLQLEEGERQLNKVPEKDVFSFDEEDQQPPAEDNQCLAANDNKGELIKLSKSQADNCLTGDQPFPEEDQQCFLAAKDSKDKLFDAGSNKSRDDNDISDYLQPDTACVSPMLNYGKETGSEEAFLFKRMHRVRQRKNDQYTDNSPAKRIKKSTELSPASQNRGHFLSREVPSYFTSKESPIGDGKSNEELDGELLISYTSPIRIGKDTEMSWKSSCLAAEESRLPFIPELVLPAKGQQLQTCRRARRRNQKNSGTVQKPVDDVNLSLINENTQATDVDDPHVVSNGEMQLIAALVQKMMKKIKLKTEDKSAHILSSAMEAVQQRCQEVQEQIQADLNECTNTSRQTFQQLKLQLEEQHEIFLGLQKKWRSEFDNGLNHFKEISSQVDSSQSYLKNVSDKQKITHRRLFSSMGEFVEQHLNETEQKLIALQKAARGIRNELKVALLQIF